jgi:hypothetical protein
MAFQGAGGSSGGIGRFFVGLFMFIAGMYMLLNSIYVHSSFGFGNRLYGVGGFGITTGAIMVPFILGLGMIFFNAKNYIGWLLAGGSLALLIIGVITSIQFSFRSMSSFDLILILVLVAGGAGILLSSLRASN